jgi:hypothetical protein
MRVCCPFFLNLPIQFSHGKTRLTQNQTGEGHFDDGSNRPSGAATPVGGPGAAEGGSKAKRPRKSGGGGKKAKTAKQRLAMADGNVDGDIDMG